jgi:hypothetical protein
LFDIDRCNLTLHTAKTKVPQSPLKDLLNIWNSTHSLNSSKCTQSSLSLLLLL